MSQKFVEKLEMNEQKNVRNSVGTITFFLPRVSARNPHKCELTMIPAG